MISNAFCPGCLDFVAQVGPKAAQPAYEVVEHDRLKWHRECLDRCVSDGRQTAGLSDMLSSMFDTIERDRKKVLGLP